jgi:hypothetical protein
MLEIRSLMDQHRWGEALKRLDEGDANPGLASPGFVMRKRAQVEALSTHDPARLAKLRQQYLNMSPADDFLAIYGLAYLGFADDAFRIAQRFQAVRPDLVHGSEYPRFLFGPETAALRRDPRFMALANKFGLPQYWRATGKWPDFCDDSGLPYNCQAEAAKLKRVAALFPKTN